MIEQIVERVTGILLHPNETWDKIKQEQTSMEKLFKEYLAILAAAPAIAGFFGLVFRGENFFLSLSWGALFYVLSLLGIWLLSYAIKFLAENFKITHDELSILKLVAYSFTAFFVAGIFFIIPPLSWLSVLGLYGFYLYYTGISNLLKCPIEQKFNFTVISSFAIFIVLILIIKLADSIANVNILY
jgi:MFS family permease